jgi:hypothetical protein
MEHGDGGIVFLEQMGDAIGAMLGAAEDDDGFAHDALEQFADADLTTNTNGTLSDSAAKTIWQTVYSALQSAMAAVGMISGFSVVVDQTQNIQVTQTLVVTITILGVAYVLQINVTIGYANQLAAQPAQS